MSSRPPASRWKPTGSLRGEQPGFGIGWNQPLRARVDDLPLLSTPGHPRQVTFGHALSPAHRSRYSSPSGIASCRPGGWIRGSRCSGVVEGAREATLEQLPESTSAGGGRPCRLAESGQHGKDRGDSAAGERTEEERLGILERHRYRWPQPEPKVQYRGIRGWSAGSPGLRGLGACPRGTNWKRSAGGCPVFVPTRLDSCFSTPLKHLFSLYG